ncbi:hypothetical protein [Nocardiopsis sp. NPDC057823]|uniref:hypothetical protein n=1 Tax=Nocardiopsis sp. NPDC057823 TaxID=3346256 RepID=UPI00366ADE4E
MFPVFLLALAGLIALAMALAIAVLLVSNRRMKRRIRAITSRIERIDATAKAAHTQAERARAEQLLASPPATPRRGHGPKAGRPGRRRNGGPHLRVIRGGGGSFALVAVAGIARHGEAGVLAAVVLAAGATFTPPTPQSPPPLPAAEATTTHTIAAAPAQGNTEVASPVQPSAPTSPSADTGASDAPAAPAAESTPRPPRTPDATQRVPEPSGPERIHDREPSPSPSPTLPPSTPPAETLAPDHQETSDPSPAAS